MKINKTKAYAFLGSLVLGFAFFAMTGVNSASAACNDNCNYPPVGGNCTVSVSRAETGEVVKWTGRGTGGNGFYSYRWTGTDGLSSSYPTIGKSYSTTGTKTGTVVITSNGQSVTRTCQVVIKDEDSDNNDNDDLDAYCKASPSRGEVDERIKWTVYAEGGDGDYDYDWDGDDGLRGDDRVIYHRYDEEGNYDAEVEVRSDGDRVTARCDVDIEDDEDDRDRDRDDDKEVTGGIYLSSIPATGITPGMKATLFVSGLLMWSAFLAYLYIARKNEKLKHKKILEFLN